MFLFPIDINGCYAQVCLEMDFPHGNCQILIDKSLAEENIDFDFDKGKLISKKSNLPIYGLLKAQIIPSYKYQPFFPYRFKNKIYYVLHFSFLATIHFTHSQLAISILKVPSCMADWLGWSYWEQGNHLNVNYSVILGWFGQQ